MYIQRIRRLESWDVDAVQQMYRRAFSGPPWNEDLSEEEVHRRWLAQSSIWGFGGLVALEEEQVVGATWWNMPTEEELRRERGDMLADFVQACGNLPIIWWCETCVDPSSQHRGIARDLKLMAKIQLMTTLRGRLILTRMRDDNTGIIRLNHLLGFTRTLIRVPSSQKPGVFHEYWFLPT